MFDDDSPTGSDHMELTLESGNEDASAAAIEAEPTAKRHGEINKEIQRLEKLMRDFRDTIQ